MAAKCPNKSHPDWKYAVEQLGGEIEALNLYDILGEELPTKEQVDSVVGQSSESPLTFEEIERVANMIINKLNIPSRPFRSPKKDTGKFKEDYLYNSDEGIKQLTTVNILRNIFGDKLVSNNTKLEEFLSRDLKEEIDSLYKEIS